MTHLCLFGLYENREHLCSFMTNDDNSFVSHLIHEHFGNEHAMNWLNGDESLGQLRQDEALHSFSSVRSES